MWYYIYAFQRFPEQFSMGGTAACAPGKGAARDDGIYGGPRQREPFCVDPAPAAPDPLFRGAGHRHPHLGMGARPARRGASAEDGGSGQDRIPGNGGAAVPDELHRQRPGRSELAGDGIVPGGAGPGAPGVRHPVRGGEVKLHNQRGRGVPPLPSPCQSGGFLTV